MIKSLDIEGLRGISRCRIDDLGQFNVFIGCNNCGKSTILDSADAMPLKAFLDQYFL